MMLHIHRDAKKIRRRNLYAWLALAALSFVLLILGMTTGRSETLLPHPAGCPRIKFCGCGAAVEIFSRPIRSLWPSSAWLRFPRAAAPGFNTVAWRPGHVMVLKRQVRGTIWLVADYNSGRHLSRLHERSIAGYVIVQPGSAHAAL